jgi:glutamine amidotransferase
MTSRVVIVDYGIGNLFSVYRALEVCGAKSIIVSGNSSEILAADHLILPGVGAFADGIRGLKERGLDKVICQFAHSKRPLLGICLGMQLFATLSHEFGEHAGLNLIPGEVIEIPYRGIDGSTLKTPYIGWSELNFPTSQNGDKSILTSITSEHFVYLVHSFHVIPDDTKNILATYEYGGYEITAAIKKSNVTGLQFHPENSGQVGLAILADFIKE